jgi:hypothetical protein
VTIKLKVICIFSVHNSRRFSNFWFIFHTPRSGEGFISVISCLLSSSYDTMKCWGLGSERKGKERFHVHSSISTHPHTHTHANLVAFELRLEIKDSERFPFFFFRKLIGTSDLCSLRSGVRNRQRASFSPI